MVAQFFNGNFENVFLCLLTLVLLLLPTIIERSLQIDLPNTLEIIIMLFIFAAEILGEIRAFYTTFQGWDTMLHTLNGFLCAAIGFSLVDLFNRNERFSLSLSPVFMAIVAFCFSMTIGVLWEFFECAMDQLFLLDMQQDMVVNSISSVMLDPTGGNTPVMIKGITDVIVVAGGEEISLGLGGGKRLTMYLLLFLLSLGAVARLLPVWAVCLLVLAGVLVSDRRVLVRVDWSLLLTFVGFFVFVGNLGRVPALHDLLQQLLLGHEVVCAVLACQALSNVPAALLLSGFTDNGAALVAGTNLGGLGTLIASMASLISYKQIALHDAPLRWRYLGWFTLANLVFLGLLLGLYLLLHG